MSDWHVVSTEAYAHHRAYVSGISVFEAYVSENALPTPHPAKEKKDSGQFRGYISQPPLD